MRKLILWTISIAVIISVFVIVNSFPKRDKGEIELFKKHKDDFELITEHIIENYDTESEDSVMVYWENDVPYLYNNSPITLKDDLVNAFNNIVDAFQHYEFSFVDITPDRISYGGLGHRMYVYSRNGKVPDYFYFKGDDMNYTCYRVDENWYLLRNNVR